jgi:tetratricopeptide (TPR) repeat protein
MRWRSSNPDRPDEESEALLRTAAETRKAEGTAAFKAGEFASAAAHYEAALSFTGGVRAGMASGADVDELCSLYEGIWGTPAEVEQLVLSLRLNAAAARLKTSSPVEALAHCDAALALDKESNKALYRKGQALLALDEAGKARKVLMEAYTLEPKNKAVIALLRKTDAAAKSAKSAQRERNKKMFGGSLLSELEGKERATPQGLHAEAEADPDERERASGAPPTPQSDETRLQPSTQATASTTSITGTSTEGLSSSSQGALAELFVRGPCDGCSPGEGQGPVSPL